MCLYNELKLCKWLCTFKTKLLDSLQLTYANISTTKIQLLISVKFQAADDT